MKENTKFKQFVKDFTFAVKLFIILVAENSFKFGQYDSHLENS